MGEYIRNTVTGEEIKIGVLDRCFFGRKQIKGWLEDPNWIGWYGDKPEEGTLEYYINSPNSLYEGIDGLRHKDFPIRFVLDESITIEHEEVYIWKKGQRGNGYQYKEECQLKDSKELWAVIIGERYNEKGECRTIFACDCCGVWFSLPQNKIDEALEMMDEANREYLKPILKGYKETCKV